ncbi:hypothetical protein BDV09DRAFT_203248 [Aspergillus tetrazonus]
MLQLERPNPPVRKLKDSCDVCSASKLRCDKQKPTCARPARRGGRPHRVRRDRSKSQSQIQSQSPRQCFGILDANTSSSPFAEPTRIPSQTDSEMSCSNGWFLRTQSTAHPYNQGSQPSVQYAEVSPPSPCKNPMNTRLAAETAETDMDCTMVALSIVEQLERSKEQRPRAAAPTYMHGGLTATEACSGSSGCISLMDVVHRSAGCASESLGHDGSAPSSDSPSISSEQDPLMWSWSQPQSFSRSCSLASDSQSQVGDLSKIAKVIMQFTERYCQDAKVAAEPRAHWVTRCESLSR